MTIETAHNGAVRLSYFLRIPNVGDLVNPHIVTALTGRPTRHVGRTDAPHLLATGSVMARARPSSRIWGSGVMHPEIGIGHAAPENVYALRGARSYAALRSGGVALRDVPLGDPGFLAPSLLGVHRRPAPAFRLGLVRHYVDRRHPELARLAAQEGVADLNVHEQPEAFLLEMADCAAVASTSLHGLIFAEALGVPNVWMRAGDGVGGGDFKFLDWFSTVRRPQLTALRIEGVLSAGDLAKRAELHDSAIDAGALAGAFPHAEVGAMQAPADGPLRSIRACRSDPPLVVLIATGPDASWRRAIERIAGLGRPAEVLLLCGPDAIFAADPQSSDRSLGGVKVTQYARTGPADLVANVNAALADCFAKRAEPARYFVVEDDDPSLVVALSAQDVYANLLNSFPTAKCAGPAIDSHEQASEPDQTLEFGAIRARLGETRSEFALHCAGDPYRATKIGLRVFVPAAADLDDLTWAKPRVDEGLASIERGETLGLEQHQAHIADQLAKLR